MDIKQVIRDIPDFPKPGILFRDISPLLADPKAYHYVIDQFYSRYANDKIDTIIGIESRGFLFASTLAYKLKLPLAMIRKHGKLPPPTVLYEYTLEYGNDIIELPSAAIKQGERILLIDDLLATGGTALASCHLIEKMGGEILEIATVIELGFLKGRERLKNYKVFSQTVYE
ncbi:MAG: adenine phosphoribosyltransferase [Gammaproteobacteria bacterium]|jgi:adenine phosphoribosyltransferase